MKVTTKYVCEYCNTEYATEDKCVACESGHKTITDIITPQYKAIGVDKTGYPLRLAVVMSNGATVLYRRES